MTIPTTSLHDVTRVEQLESLPTDPTNQSVTLEWNEQRAATLLGFEDELVADAVETTRHDKENPPQATPPRSTMAHHPLAKVGLVGGVSLLAFVVIGLIFNSMTQISLKSPARSGPPSNIAEEIVNIPPMDLNHSSEQFQGALLTEAALGKQEKLLSALATPKPSPASNSTPLSPPAVARSYPTVPVSPNPVSVLPPPPPLTSGSRDFPSPPATPLDPQQQWQTASQIGSYVPVNRGGNVAAIPIAQTALSDVPPPPAPALPAIPIAVDRPAISPQEEASILQQRPIRVLTPGKQAVGRLLAPIVQEMTSAVTASQRVVVRLEQPILDESGQIVLPIGTDVMADVMPIGASGLVNLTVVSVMIQGAEYRLPPQTLTLQTLEGGPLIAHKFRDPGGDIASLDAAQAFFSGLSQVGEMINRPQSNTVITGLGTVTTTAQTATPDVAAAMMQGGFGALSQQLGARNQQAMQAMLTQPNFWFLEQGTTVQVVVNQPLQF